MTHTFRAAALFLLVLSAPIFTGCHNDEQPFSPNGPSTIDPYPGPVASSYNEKLIGDWYHLGATDGLEFRPDGMMIPLVVDLDHRLQIEPYVEVYNWPGWYTPHEGSIVVWHDYNEENDEHYTYTLDGTDSTLTLRSVDPASGRKGTYRRVGIGEVVR